MGGEYSGGGNGKVLGLICIELKRGSLAFDDLNRILRHRE
jgi:hypothetical protein